MASRNDWMLRDIYLDFEGDSHSKTRKSFMRMLKDIKNGKTDIIITRAVTRLGRNMQIIKMKWQGV